MAIYSAYVSYTITQLKRKCHLARFLWRCGLLFNVLLSFFLLLFSSPFPSFRFRHSFGHSTAGSSVTFSNLKRPFFGYVYFWGMSQFYSRLRCVRNFSLFLSLAFAFISSCFLTPSITWFFSVATFRPWNDVRTGFGAFLFLLLSVLSEIASSLGQQLNAIVEHRRYRDVSFFRAI